MLKQWLLGRSSALVQHLLGHASITITLDRYSHWIPSMGYHAADGMDGASG
jgi:integrase